MSNSAGSATSNNATLTVNTPPPPATYTEVEANNTIAAANTVSDATTKITGYIGSSTDADYFKLNLGAGRTLTVAMTGPTGSTYDYDLYFYNAASRHQAAERRPDVMCSWEPPRCRPNRSVHLAEDPRFQVGVILSEKGTMDIQKFAAFSDGNAGGNPAGVVITEQFPADLEMQRTGFVGAGIRGSGPVWLPAGGFGF